MTTSENIARRFHELYEQLAQEHGYTTRAASAVPWVSLPEQNKSLMIHVVNELLAEGTIKR